MLSLSPWMTVSLAECVAIVTINLYMIIAFKRSRNLRKRSRNLVMNLAAIDMFVEDFAVYDLFNQF